jgi:sulfur transfer protein SufE
MDICGYCTRTHGHEDDCPAGEIESLRAEVEALREENERLLYLMAIGEKVPVATDAELYEKVKVKIAALAAGRE